MIQNQLFDVAADQIRQKILDRMKRAVWYTVIADEVTDISNKEQLSVVLRYVDPDTILVREDLVSFFEYDEGITGSNLAEKSLILLRALVWILVSYGVNHTMEQAIWQAESEAQQLSLVHSTPLLSIFIVHLML